MYSFAYLIMVHHYIPSLHDSLFLCSLEEKISEIVHDIVAKRAQKIAGHGRQGPELICTGAGWLLGALQI